MLQIKCPKVQVRYHGFAVNHVSAKGWSAQPVLLLVDHVCVRTAQLDFTGNDEI